jgi:hypothetical protein
MRARPVLARREVPRHNVMLFSRVTLCAFAVTSAMVALIGIGCNDVLGISGWHDVPCSGSCIDGGGTEDALPSTAYVAAVLSDQPVAYWHLDETSGSVAEDASGHHNDGQYVGTYGGTGCSLGVPGAMAQSRAVSFGEASCYLDMGDIFPFTGTSSYSIELWFYDDQDAGATVNHSLVDRNTLVGPQNGYDVYFNASFTLFSRLCGDAGEEGYAGIDSGPPVGQWTHFVATYDGTMTTLYLNGQVRASLASPDPQGSGTGVLRFGQSARTPDPALGGALDEIAVYDKALSSTSVHNHFTAASP